MRCECGTESESNFCPNCGRPIVKDEKYTITPENNKKSILDKLEFLTDKRTMLSAGCVLSGVYCIFAGYWFTAPLLFVGAVLFSPQMRRKHSAEVKMLSILGSLMIFLGICFGVLHEVLVEAVWDEAEAENSYYSEYTTNEERYGGFNG